MPLRKNEIGKLYYRIGEVANMFGVNTSLIRFYENEFDIIKPHRNKKGNRLFTQADVDNFHVIFSLIKEKGYTLDGAKQHLKKQNKIPDNQEVVRTLLRVKRFLLEIRSDL
ncbi:MAG: MerR family transcriptional regulator [Bacteroidetes bacterium]|nr:MerR family transcriptional regulator [Bacteroidota bacterium]